MYKLLLLASFLLSSLCSYAQKHYKPEEGQEFMRQVKATREYKDMQHRADSANLDTNAVPHEVQFHVIREQQEGLDPDIQSGLLEHKLVIMKTPLESCNLLYDRNKKKITSMKCGKQFK